MLQQPLHPCDAVDLMDEQTHAVLLLLSVWRPTSVLSLILYTSLPVCCVHEPLPPRPRLHKRECSRLRCRVACSRQPELTRLWRARHHANLCLHVGIPIIPCMSFARTDNSEVGFAGSGDF